MPRHRHRDPELLREIGQRIQKMRTERRLTQQQVAQEIGIEPETLSRVENGGCALSLGNFAKMSEVFGVELGDVVNVTRPLPVPQFVAEEQECLNLFRQMQGREKRVALEILKALLKHRIDEPR